MPWQPKPLRHTEENSSVEIRLYRDELEPPPPPLELEPLSDSPPSEAASVFFSFVACEAVEPEAAAKDLARGFARDFSLAFFFASALPQRRSKFKGGTCHDTDGPLAAAAGAP